MNPFKYGCIVDGKNFCSRPRLARQMSEYIRSGQNLVIQGERRIGKSSLVTNTVKAMKGYRLLYADFMDVRTVADIQFRVLRALAKLGGAHPLSGEFLGEASVSNTAMVKRSLTALCAARLVYIVANEYKFANPFFREWIRRK